MYVYVRVSKNDGRAGGITEHLAQQMPATYRQQPCLSVCVLDDCAMYRTVLYEGVMSLADSNYSLPIRREIKVKPKYNHYCIFIEGL